MNKLILPLLAILATPAQAEIEGNPCPDQCTKLQSETVQAISEISEMVRITLSAELAGGKYVRLRSEGGSDRSDILVDESGNVGALVCEDNICRAIGVAAHVYLRQLRQKARRALGLVEELSI